MNENQDISEQLSAYLDGELVPAEAARIESLLAKDDALARELARLRATRELLRSLPKAHVSPDFAEKVLQVAAGKRLLPGDPTARSTRTGLNWRKGLAAAAVVVVALGAGGVLSVWFYEPPKKNHRELAMRDRPENLRRGGERKTPVDGAPTHPRFFSKSRNRVAQPGAAGEKGEEFAHKATAEGGCATHLGKLGTSQDGVPVERLARLAARNEVIFTDNLPAGQKQVEAVLISNNIQIAPTNQRTLACNQANQISPPPQKQRGISAGFRVDGSEVQYVVYGDAGQLRRVREELEQNVRARQMVSQLSEPVSQKALDKFCFDGSAAEAKAPASGPTTAASRPVARTKLAFGVDPPEAMLITLRLRRPDRLDADEKADTAPAAE